MLSRVPDSPNSLSASWMVPDTTNGIISGYTINCTTQSEEGMMTFNIDAGNTATMLGDLRAFTEYTCVISATTGAGEGAFSDPQTETTAEDSKCESEDY